MSDKPDEQEKPDRVRVGAAPPKYGTVLTAEQTAKALTWFNEKFPKASLCHECNHDTFIGSKLVTTVNVEDRGMSLGGMLMPMVTLICPNCGSTRLFNALVMGIIAPDEEKDGEGTKPAPKLGGAGGDKG